MLNHFTTPVAMAALLEIAAPGIDAGLDFGGE
jgi:hypothetical protein